MGDLEVYAGAAILGALTGIRSMAAPTIVGQLSRNGALAELKGPMAFVSGPRFATASSLMAAGELVMDKLPIAANRTAAGPLVGRALMGGYSGATVCLARHRSGWLGAVIGAAAAVGAAYGAYQLRERAAGKLHIPNSVIGLAEDALVGAAALALTSRLRSQA